METQICTKCGEEKPVTKEFYQSNGRGGFRRDCKKCVNSRRRNNFKLKEEQNKKRRERYRKDINYRLHLKGLRLKSTFGINLEKYEKMLEEQDFKCKICGKEEVSTSRTGQIKGLAVDHCHKHEKETGEIKVRGLLCENCNKGIGSLQDDINILKRAIDYIEKEGDI